MSGPGRVVAELGRPETPAETAARRAENSRLRRSRQTARNLMSSLLVTIGLVVVIIALVPRGAAPATRNVDYRQLASQASASVQEPLLAPRLPAGWHSNSAELRGTDAVTSWYVGFVTPENQYLGYSEGIDANDTWLSNTLAKARSAGTARVGGLTWRVYDQRALGTAAGNVAYALATGIGTTDLAVYGTSTPAETNALAAALAADARGKGLTGANTVPKG